MEDNLRSRLKISPDRLDEINALLLDPNSRVINDLLCTRRLDTATLASEEKLEFTRHFADAIARLDALDPHHLFLDRRQPEWIVSKEGLDVLRLLALCFDQYTPQTAPEAPAPERQLLRTPR